MFHGDCASLEDPTPKATRPLHHTASLTFISPDGKQCGEDWRYSLPPHLAFWVANQVATLVKVYHVHVHVCIVCLCFIAEWSIPVVTGDTPPPASDFTFTKISADQGVMFGGYGPNGFSSELRVATVSSRDSVVSVN